MHIVPPSLFVTPLDRKLEPALQAAIAGKAKPLGSLGRIEALALHIGLVTGSLTPSLGRAALVVFAGDHGIVSEGVTAYPSEVSALVAQMVLDGKAGANIAAQAAGAEVFLIDAGLKTQLSSHPGPMNSAVGQGTRNFLKDPAMTEAELRRALETGAAVAESLKEQGFGILALGELGIGNSSAAALVGHAVTALPFEILVGHGAGTPPQGLEHKRSVLARAYARAPVSGGRNGLREFGGYEMAMLAGAMLCGARHGQILLVDGFIATSAACAAISIEPALRDYLLFAHRSPEAGHPALLEWLGADPLLDLRMRLGEGTGAALAIPLLRMAEGLLNTMADLSGAHPSS
jgi:nicotinate-nucleotide--dimethylbenzimidazole phosphoribosyltransferase